MFLRRLILVGIGKPEQVPQQAKPRPLAFHDETGAVDVTHHFGERDILALKVVAGQLARDGVQALNERFRRLMEENLFELYHGPVGNTFRTKYRDSDRPFTAQGLRHLHEAGILAIVHGHRNRTRGQRIMLRQGMIHIESDITMDRNSRKKEGLKGYGVGVTIVRPEGHVIGISTDYPRAKVFAPEHYLR